MHSHGKTHTSFHKPKRVLLGTLEAWTRTLEFYMYYEMCLIDGCVSRYMDMLEYNVMAKGRRWQKAIADKAVATATV